MYTKECFFGEINNLLFTIVVNINNLLFTITIRLLITKVNITIKNKY